MGCTPSVQISPSGGFCTKTRDDRSPPYSSNHLLLSGGSTAQSTPSRPEREKGGGLLPGHEGQLQILLVFPKEDGVCEAWSSCCKKQGHNVVTVGSIDDILKVHLDHLFDLVIVDARSSKYFKPEEVVETVRGCEGGSATVLAAVVRRSSVERDSGRVQSLLNNGFSKIIVESSFRSAVQNELLQLERTDLALQQQNRILSALFIALDSCKDIIHVTDSQHKIQYVNRACEIQLGYTFDELSGKTIWEVHGSDLHRQELKTPSGSDYNRSTEVKSVNDGKITENKESKVNLDFSEAVNMQMRRGKEWEGVVSCRRKSGDVINLTSRVTPVFLQPRRSDYFVYASDGHAPERFDTICPRGSIKSLRKGSYDVRSLTSDGSIMRRQSVAKLHSVMVEAPINRVVSIVTAAQNSSPAYIAQALEKVLEILRSTELYNPQLIQDNHSRSIPVADPVATDLLGGLLSHGPKPLSAVGGRRSSGEQAVKPSFTGSSTHPRPYLPNMQHASTAIKEILKGHLCWDLDIIQLEKLTDKKPLVWLGMSLMCQMNVPSTLGCDEQTLQNWLTLIEANYQSTNSYHNSTHAADVLQTTAYFLQQERVKDMFDPLDAAASLIAAAVHDVDHPGKNSQFLCNTNNHLAILYNDVCVLESHHSAFTFKLTFSDDRVNILKGLDSESYKFVRKTIIDMVLATDMAKHFEHVNKYINMLEKCTVPVSDEGSMDCEPAETLDLNMVSTPENLIIVKRMMIKCADISNPLRPLYLCKDWAHRIANEYFNQTEEEKRRQIPVVMPQFDRNTCSIPKSQIGFIDFFIVDMFEAWHELADIPLLLDILKENYQYWKEQEETERQITEIAEEGDEADTPTPTPELSSSRASGKLNAEEIIIEEIS